jgi:hypothetical protein
MAARADWLPDGLENFDPGPTAGSLSPSMFATMDANEFCPNTGSA